MLRHIKPVSGQPLTFRTSGIGRPQDVTLIPFNKLHRQRYSVYWQLISEGEWKLRSADIAAAEARRMAEEARVVDVVRPGESQSETDHRWQGENTQTGDTWGFKWREAKGWFSYEVKVVPGQPLQLVVTLRGGKKDAESFDVLVNGKIIAAQPGGGPDAVYPLSPEITQGKNSATVQFAAHSGKTIPSISGVRVLRERK
jgi:hypothetical protein